MLRISRRFLPALFAAALAASAAPAQDNLRTQLFAEVDQLLQQAKEKKADIYAPASFEKASEYYRRATDDYSRGHSLEDIREQVKNASAYFAKSLDETKAAEVTLSAAMASRTDAGSSGAPRFSPELWRSAEARFNAAARSLESGDLESAKSGAREAESTYRAAELEAIKANFLTPARQLMQNAEGMGAQDNAPQTFGKARRLAQAVEELLKQNRYDTDSARQLAEQAKVEAAHAIYLHKKIAQMKQESRTIEDGIVSAEMEFQKVAGALGFLARFDTGFGPPVRDAIAAVKARDQKLADAADRLRQQDDLAKSRDQEIENLRQQVAAMQARLGSLTESEKQLQRQGADLQQKLTLKHEQETTVKQVSYMFMEEEGNVLRDGDNIIVRLYGLTFPVGKNTIEPQFYGLLTKVQEAVRKFPNCRVTIEGHTDSQGSDAANQALSQSRAKAVAEYLMANMGVEMAVSYEGYGESRPVASNDTPEGRAKNRRIDVVITPEWAGK